jgi:O-antigen ligase
MKYSYLGILLFSVLLLVPIPFAANINILEIIVLFTGVIYIIKSKNLTSIPKESFSVLRLLSIYILLITIGFLYAPDQIKVLKEFIKWFEILIIALIVYSYSHTSINFKRVYWFFTVLVCIYFLSTIMASIFQEGSRIRVGAIVVFLLSLTIPFTLRNKVKFIITTTTMSTLFLLTESRAIWIAMIIVLLMSFLNFNIRNRLKTSLLFLLPFILLVFIFGFDEMISDRMSHLNISNPDTMAYSTLQRVYRIQASYYAFIDSPVIGVGAGNLYEYLVSSNHLNLFEWLEWLDKNERTSIVPHNLFAQNAAELGIVGLLTFLLILLKLFKIVRKIEKGKHAYQDNYTKGLYLSFFVLIVFLSFGYISGIHRLIIGVFFGLIVALPKYCNKNIDRGSLPS